MTGQAGLILENNSRQAVSTMTWRVEIKDKENIFDALGEGVYKDILDLGINRVQKVKVSCVYTLDGDLTEENIRRIAGELLTNTITQDHTYADRYLPPARASEDLHIIEIAYNPGVMDPVEESAMKGIRDLGIDGAASVRASKKYFLYGKLNEKDLETIVNKVLANKLIQHVVKFEEKTHPGGVPGVFPPPGYLRGGIQVIVVDLLKANDRELVKLSRQGQFFLNLNEMKAIQRYFRKIRLPAGRQGRNPTDCELETIAQTWSEHCYHKTFRGIIRYRETEKGRTKTKVINNLLKSTIAKATYSLNKSWCVSVFHDNAGVIKFDNEHHVCFKVETHNHPSALEPFGGANTGVGGVIRDTLGTGLGAKPICNTDVFCFAPPDFPWSKLPAGTLHPKRVMKGVVSGVRDYGNKMGIPTVNGAVLFDERFVGNPLVYCGSVGLLPVDKVKKTVHKGDLAVVLGGRTGRDGIHGATFSSGELTSESEVVSSGAVQIGNPIQEKKVLDALLKARDENLYCAVTDCGAGGLSSAVGEMGQELGVRVQLENVPLKYQGLNYTEIWISESQERMVIAVPKDKFNRLQEIFKGENVEAAAIGEFTGTKRLEIFYGDCRVADLDMEFLHAGPPKISRDAVWKAPIIKEKKVAEPKDLTEKLFAVLAHYNVCSKEWIIRQYDHEVQGASVIKPLVGIKTDGPSDASVLAPKLGSTKGIAIANGINPRYGMIDPYWMAASCIDEAVRQIVSVGGDVSRIAILDNFCWGNPDKPDRLGSLVRCAEGCYKIALDYGVPFISGKDSLYNEYTQGKKSIAIPGTILISAIGIIEDVTKCVTMDFKRAGNLIYLAGTTGEEMGGSIYLDTFGLLGANVPKVNAKQAMKIFQALHKAVKAGTVASSHDCSDGGLGTALAEMAFAGNLGAAVRLDKVHYRGKAKRDDYILFSESNSRFVVEVDPQQQKNFEKIMKGLPFSRIGRVEEPPEFVIYGMRKNVCVQAAIDDLKKAWQKPLQW